MPVARSGAVWPVDATLRISARHVRSKIDRDGDQRTRSHDPPAIACRRASAHSSYTLHEKSRRFAGLPLSVFQDGLPALIEFRH